MLVGLFMPSLTLDPPLFTRNANQSVRFVNQSHIPIIESFAEKPNGQHIQLVFSAETQGLSLH